MKTSRIVVLAIAAALGGLWAFHVWDHSPTRVAEQIRKVREANPDLGQHIEDYSKLTLRVGLPFRAFSEIGSLLDPIDRLRTYTVESGGELRMPWQEIANRSVHAKLLDLAMDSVMYAVEVSDGIDGYCEQVEAEASTYRAAENSELETVTLESIHRLRTASLSLAERLEEMRAAVAPAATALEISGNELDKLVAWLDEASTEGIDESFILAGMQGGAMAMRSALAIPENAVLGLADEFDEDALALREIARLASRVR